MLEFIQLIKQRYQIALTQLDKKSSQQQAYQQRIEELQLAEAFVRKGKLLADKPHFPLQIAVIGPTQAGKSSIVNLLLNSQLASASPLAGYTVHPHGYCHGLNRDQLDGLQYYFHPFQCLEENRLQRQRYDCYSLTDNPAASAVLPACILWDTPDFDSIDAAEYRDGVMRTIALADVIVLVVSKEKYADQSVWEVMQTIAGFQQPTLICINKLAEGGEAEILQSLQDKWRSYRQDPLPDIVPLLFQKQSAALIWPSSARQALLKPAKKVEHSKHAVHQQQWLNRYWQQWLEPVFAEHQALRNWQLLVDQCLTQAVSHYQRDYLNHPHHYDTFQGALLNLLNLLEIPGFAKFLGKTRRVMTWPIRQLLQLGKGFSTANLGQEGMVLNQIGEHVMIQLADKLLEKTEIDAQPPAWWKDTAVTLRLHKAEILAEYRQAVTEYQQLFQQDVDAAAQRLYHKLQEQPMVLSSLRATRATTDAAAILLAVQAGGIGLHDLVLTPMMLSISSLLAESAIGSYMGRVEAELKQQQLNTVKSALFESVLRRKLAQLPQQATGLNRFNISEQQCHQAEQALKEKKYGLRLR